MAYSNRPWSHPPYFHCLEKSYTDCTCVNCEAKKQRSINEKANRKKLADLVSRNPPGSRSQPKSEPKPPVDYFKKWSDPLPKTPLMTKAEIENLIPKSKAKK